MNEIEYRTKHSQNWRQFLERNPGLSKNHLLFRSEWCVMVGLCETAGWINTNQNHFLDWVKPGHKDI